MNNHKQPELIGEILKRRAPVDFVGDVSNTERAMAIKGADLSDDRESELHRLNRLNEAMGEQGTNIDPKTVEELKAAAQRVGEVAAEHFNSRQE